NLGLLALCGWEFLLFLERHNLEFALILAIGKRPNFQSSEDKASNSHPNGVGRLCLLDDKVSWSLPQLLWVLTIPRYFYS
ncbi:hypothetical protein IKQ19_06405, partial [Candidatus Saccharibacteria bacterium]|nr:hypothetical protein [Candidatus Saccharibacteria bacterium]